MASAIAPSVHPPHVVVELQNEQAINQVAWPNGKASDYESEDSGFDPQRDHSFASSFSFVFDL